jgi:RHS repeat-associated protein
MSMDKPQPGESESSSESKEAPSIPSITLQKGGGAIRDIGEKFSVNAITGTGSMSIPLFTSPGRSGFSPSLLLSYNSGNGNASFGLGWQLSIPSITRKTDKGIPLYSDGAKDSDIFLLSDAEDLTPCLALQNPQAVPSLSNSWIPLPVPDGALNGEAYAIKRYRPRTEGLFARIERWQRRSNGDLHWRAISKDNVTTIYGQNPTCRLADPLDPSRVFQWLLESTFDDKGNVAFYEYKVEDTTGVNPAAANERNRQSGYAPYVNRYLKRIHYGNQTPYVAAEDLTKRTDWLFEVVLDYGEHDPNNPSPTEEANRPWLTRADPFSNFRSSFDIRTYRLCQRILMFHHFPTDSNGAAGYDGLVRSTDLFYDQADPTSLLQGNPVATKLVSIAQTGYKLGSGNGSSPSYNRKSFPPLQFAYSEATIQSTVQTVESESLENLPLGLDGSSFQWVDLDGEGLSGILTQQADSFLYKRNISPLVLGNDTDSSPMAARFAPAELVATNPALGSPGGRPQFMSLAADGHQDLVNFSGPVRGVYRRTDEPGWEGFSPFECFPNLDTNDPNLRFLDVDGDGLTDILISEDEVFSWHRSLGEAGFGPREYVRKPYDEEHGPALIFSESDQSMFTADMTGDGLVDIVRIRNGEICYWPNLGYGRFGAKVTMDGSPFFDTPESFNPSRLRLADIDGSGTSDILYLGAEAVGIFLNQAGNSLAPQEVLPSGFPSTNYLNSVNVFDLLGNGTACLVWSSPLPSDFGRQMRYVDLMGGVKPHLLVSMINNMGAETRVRYASATKFYVEDRAAGTPWITKLPFPVYVVEKVEVFDHIGKTRLSASYRYRHGYFDGTEREFRGFGYVEQSDCEAFGESDSLFTLDTGAETDAVHVPPVVTKTWYHTGAWPKFQSISQQMALDYYGAPNSTDPHFATKFAVFLTTLLPDTVLPKDVFLLSSNPYPTPDGVRQLYLLTGEEEREAIRALKGSVLRQEIYAADGSAKAGIPYSISHRNYTIECFQPQAGNRYAVFFTHARETIDYHLERNPLDPRVSHNAALAVDVFGNVVKSISAGYGRNLTSGVVPLAPSVPPGSWPNLTLDASTFAQPEQLTANLTLSENDLTVAVDATDSYRTPKVAESRTYEITRPVRPDDSTVYAFSDLLTLATTATEIPYEVTPDPTQTQKRLISKTRTLHLSNDLSGPMPLGQIDSLGLVYQSYQLAMTANLAQQIFVNGNSNPNKPVTLGALNTFLSGPCGYVHSQGDSDWWIPSGFAIYSPVPSNPSSPFVQNSTYASAHFFVAQAHCDPFGQYTRFTYDLFNLCLVQTEDALGNIVTAQYDYRVLQSKEMVDANGNHTQVAFDLLGMLAGTAVMGKITPGTPSESGDTLTGFVTDLQQSDIDTFVSSANPAPQAAGLLRSATTRYIYNLNRFSETQASNPTDSSKWQPNFAATLARETHVSQALPAGRSLKVQVSFGYSDGLGREIQRKIQAEPGPVVANGPTINPRWVGSGWTILNNKGKPVRRYEPFFSATQNFEFANIVGVSPTLFYDPLLRVILTFQPDNTYVKVLFDPWRQETWDANDTVKLDPRTDPDVVGFLGDYFKTQPSTWQTWLQQRLPDPANPPADSPGLPSDQAAAVRTLAHAGTSTATCFDVLGRTFLTVSNNGPNAQSQAQFYSIRTELDIEGNQLTVSDALGRQVMASDYGQAKNLLHNKSMEAGERWSLSNVLGKTLQSWDGRGFTRVTSYDQLQRPTSVQVSDSLSNTFLAERTVYGDSTAAGPTNPDATNHRGRVYQTFDDPGVVTTLGLNPASNQNEGYDFKGNLLRNSRQLLGGNAYRSSPDWSRNPTLDEVFSSSSVYDALNRPISVTTPDASVISPSYNEANFLEQVQVNLRGAAMPTPFITNIDYDAKGQRLLIEYGNGARTDYAYDPVTFRLVNLRTDLNVPPPAANPGKLQNLTYAYDPVGNITNIQDAAQQTIYFNNQVVRPSNDYTFDAIYRLIKAAGREHLGQIGGTPNAPTPESYNDGANLNLPHPNDGQAMGLYVENFGYDPAGNIGQIQHLGSSPVNPGWTRLYTYAEPSLIDASKFSNRLSKTMVGQATDSYSYDAHGNMLSMAQLQAMSWDFKDQLQMTQRQAVNSNDTDGVTNQGERTYYVYDSTGQRLRKVTESSTGAPKNERIYLGGFEVYREYDASGATVTLERQSLHVMDDKQRVALVESLTQGSDGSPQQLIRYQFSNHLGSACLELNSTGNVISYEEYYPYGGTSYQAVNSSIKAAAKRYRYTGKERDEETGLNYHVARYYAPWLGRWTAVDPVGIKSDLCLYAYCRGNPLALTDKSGKDPLPPIAEKTDPTFHLKAPFQVTGALHPGALKLSFAGDLDVAQHTSTVITGPNAGRSDVFTSKATLQLASLSVTDKGHVSFSAELHLDPGFTGVGGYETNVSVKADVSPRVATEGNKTNLVDFSASAKTPFLSVDVSGHAFVKPGVLNPDTAVGVAGALLTSVTSGNSFTDSLKKEGFGTMGAGVDFKANLRVLGLPVTHVFGSVGAETKLNVLGASVVPAGTLFPLPVPLLGASRSVSGGSVGYNLQAGALPLISPEAMSAGKPPAQEFPVYGYARGEAVLPTGKKPSTNLQIGGEASVNVADLISPPGPTPLTTDDLIKINSGVPPPVSPAFSATLYLRGTF